MNFAQQRELGVMNEMASLAISKVIAKKKATDLMKNKLVNLRLKQQEQKREIEGKQFKRKDSISDSLFDSEEDNTEKNRSYGSLELESDSDDSFTSNTSV